MSQEAQETPSELNSKSQEEMIPQSQVNDILAKHKGNLQKELENTKTELSDREKAFLELKKEVEQLTEGETLEGFKEHKSTLEQILVKLDSETERATKEKKKQEELIKELNEKANDYQSRYTSTLVNHAISSAAGPKAVSGAASRLIGVELFSKGRVLDDGSVVFNMQVPDDDGEIVTRDVTAQEAVEALERDVTNWGTLFKSTVNSGVGSEADGLARNPRNGEIDLTKLSYEEHVKLKSANPDLFNKLAQNL